MPKILIIENCKMCWHCHFTLFDAQDKKSDYCLEAKRSITDKFKIPVWCPLPDAEGKDD